ncbi:MAG TPA: endonuclease/exonuclease/phosphatase family protein [Solirubrobacteraceae bacterium]|nr:endonuclease/exonuclease/phosphatase family protein [Solirubrobacteraceae bacterium]
MDLRVLTWNLFHGRAVPPAGRDLYDEFSTALEGWAWDVALLQEVPPWWPQQLARTLGCEMAGVLTSRTALLPVRRALAVRAPDLMRSGAGGANAILARSDRIVQGRAALLCRRPERRRVHGVSLAVGVWVSNLHASAGPSPAAERDVHTAIRASQDWARTERLPLILGGDLNLRQVTGDGLQLAASSDVDHVLCDESIKVRAGTIARPDHGVLSDHAPLAVTLSI